MNINNITLSEQLLSELYPTLVADVAEQQANLTIQPKNQAKKYLGKNAKHILILSKFQDAVHLPDTMLEFLSNILLACKLTLADVAIANLSDSDQDASLLLKETDPSVVLLFGIEPDELGLPLRFPQFQVQKFNKVTYLSAGHLELIKENKELKSRLWNCLKNIFNL
ncbi:MAG: hypothetical protein GC171_16615 [Terrimonas sp.]|nr:hypothetical protein [Terrimonas sp.]